VPAVLDAIRDADIITLGPGSLFTSLIPNLLVNGLARAIRSSNALKLYICNLMTQPGETSGFAAADHLRAINEHAEGNLFDAVVLNDAPIDPGVLARYRAEGAEPVMAAADSFREQGIHVVERNLLARGAVVRHDPALLSQAVYEAYAGWTGRVTTANRADLSS
jgi:uncharacterized cofD-like protein